VELATTRLSLFHKSNNFSSFLLSYQTGSKPIEQLLRKYGRETLWIPCCVRQILSVYLESSLENVVDNVDKKLKMLIDNKCESNDDAMNVVFNWCTCFLTMDHSALLSRQSATWKLLTSSSGHYQCSLFVHEAVIITRMSIHQGGAPNGVLYYWLLVLQGSFNKSVVGT
jgi:hypothetical protein